MEIKMKNDFQFTIYCIIQYLIALSNKFDFRHPINYFRIQFLIDIFTYR